MFKKLLTTRSLCLSAIIAALYAALTLLLAHISYGNIQCRVSEAFTVLPMVLPQANWKMQSRSEPAAMRSRKRSVVSAWKMFFIVVPETMSSEHPQR